MRKTALFLMMLMLMMAVSIASDEEPLTLEDCLEMAVRNNPAIHAAKWSGGSVTYRRKAATAHFLPVFRAEYAHTWLDERPTFEIPATPGMTIPGGTQDVTIDLSSMGLPPATVPVTFPDTTTPGSPAMELPAGNDEIDSVTVSVTQPLFTGGAIWQGYKLAKLQEIVAKLQSQDVNGEIIYQTRVAFYSSLKAREFVRVAEKAVEMGESLRKRTLDFYEVGMIAKNQLLEAEVNLAQMEQNLTDAQTGFNLARTGLGLLIGHSEGELVDVRGELVVTTVELSLEQSLQTGLRVRPDVRAAQIRVEMANRAVKLERSSWVPQVAAIGTYKHEEGSFSSDEDILSFTIGAQWTFWEWGRKYYNVKSAKFLSRAAAESLRLARDQAVLQIKQAYLKIQQSQRKVKTAQASLFSAEENLRVVEARFDQQMATSFDVLKAQTLLTQAETNLISAKADHITAKAELERATGLTIIPSAAPPQPGVTETPGENGEETR